MFLQNGYRGTSMDEIAARAGVSKQTVYKQFGDKEGLFTEIVLGTIDQVGEPFFAGIGTLEDSENLEPELREPRPPAGRDRRGPAAPAAAAPGGRGSRPLPRAGPHLLRAGPGRTSATLTSTFQNLAERGLLQLKDPSSPRSTSTGWSSRFRSIGPCSTRTWSSAGPSWSTSRTRRFGSFSPPTGSKKRSLAEIPRAHSRARAQERHRGRCHRFARGRSPCEATVRVPDRERSSPTFAIEGRHYALIELDGLPARNSHEYEVLLDDRRVWPEPESHFPPLR